MRFVPGKLLLLIFAVCSFSSGFVTRASAIEVQASWQTFATPTGPFTTSQTGQNGSNAYFSDLTMSFQNMVASNNPVSPTTNPTFDNLQGGADGDPSSATGQWIQLNFTKTAPYADYSFTITDIVVRFWNDSGDPGGPSSGEIHFYSNVGGFDFRPNSPQMNSNGTGILSGETATPPAGTRNYVIDSATPGGTMQNNTIDTAASSYQIRMAPDKMFGNDPHWAMATFNTATVGVDTFSLPSNSVIAVFGTATNPVPEPSTYKLATLGVVAVGLIEARRRRARKTARTA